MTVAVRWPKGVVAEPPKPSAMQLAIAGPGAPCHGFWPGLLAGLLGYYFLAWKRAGRGPRAGTMVPLFAPPEGMSAAAVRYVKRMGFDDRCFAAAIVESGVRARAEAGGRRETASWAARRPRSSGHRGKQALQRGERAMLTELFTGSNTIEMDDANHVRFGAARKALQDESRRRLQGRRCSSSNLDMGLGRHR